MNSIDFLEHGGGDFKIRLFGQLIPLGNPRELHYQVLLHALEQGCTPGLPEMVPIARLPEIFHRWRAAWDLPTFNEARRLAYLVDHYRPAIARDLMTYSNLDLGDLWRARRWTLLLDIIDRLPPNSYYVAAVSMDEEHSKMLAESILARREAGEEEPEKRGPSLTSWSPEVAMLTNIFDAVRGVQHAVVAVQAPQGKAPEPPKPAERPTTPLESILRKMEFTRRKAKHDSLVARVLPHKR